MSRKPVAKPTHCGCGAPLTQPRLGRPRVHCGKGSCSWQRRKQVAAARESTATATALPIFRDKRQADFFQEGQ